MQLRCEREIARLFKLSRRCARPKVTQQHPEEVPRRYKSGALCQSDGSGWVRHHFGSACELGAGLRGVGAAKPHFDHRDVEPRLDSCSLNYQKSPTWHRRKDREICIRPDPIVAAPPYLRHDYPFSGQQPYLADDACTGLYSTIIDDHHQCKVVSTPSGHQPYGCVRRTNQT